MHRPRVARVSVAPGIVSSQGQNATSNSPRLARGPLLAYIDQVDPSVGGVWQHLAAFSDVRLAATMGLGATRVGKEPRPTLDCQGAQLSKHTIDIDILAQPDDQTCGPTCLHAVYRYYDDDIQLSDMIGQIDTLASGGTLAVILGCHALRRGYAATIYTCNLQLFDPSWFSDGFIDPRVDVADRLRSQLAAKGGIKLEVATRAYLEYLSRGGVMAYRELGAGIIREHLQQGLPILTGLSATYLYGCPREYNDEYDDVRGDPTGHFVVVCGYEQRTGNVSIADPMQDNPRYGDQYYHVSIERLIGAILLGALSYDANLLVIEPRS